MATDKMVATLGKIKPTLNDRDLENSDIIVEAVVENPQLKKSVLAELEKQMPTGTVLTSNTSTIRIDELASALRQPRAFLWHALFQPSAKNAIG